MSVKFNRLPLRSLAVFEAAARHGKFAAAAEELLMTQAGVSQYISQLEADLGVALFERQHRGVTLTAAGQVFQQSVSQGLQTLSDGWTSMQQLSGERTLHILTDFGFAAWWLIPRISALSELMPGVDIRLVTNQSEIDAAKRDFDLAIVFGSGNWAGFDSSLLFREEVFPVCSPAYLAGRKLAPGQEQNVPLAAEDIATLRLLHLRSNPPQRWFDWSDWFTGVGIQPPVRHQELTFNNYQMVLQAVLLGQGVGLGWAPLVNDLIDQGALVRLSEKPLYSSRGYHLVTPPGEQEKGYAHIISTWLKAELQRKSH